MQQVAREIKSEMWREVFKATLKVFDAYLKQYPGKRLYTPIWDNPHIHTRANRKLSYARNINSRDKLVFPYQILGENDSGTITYLEPGTARRNLNIRVCNNTYNRWKNAVETMVKKHKIKYQQIDFQSRPAITQFLLHSDKGCSWWTKLQRYTFSSRQFVTKIENRWELRFGNPANQRTSIDFWNMVHRRNKELKFDNKIRMLQYEINRDSLKTNIILSKFVAGRTDKCTFCDTQRETITHLFVNCNITRNLLTSIEYYWQNWMKTTRDPLTTKEIIFGKFLHNLNLKRYILVLYYKRYIWIKRCKKEQISLISFNTWFRHEMKIQIYIKNLDFENTDLF